MSSPEFEYVNIDIFIKPKSNTFETKRRRRIYSDIAYVVDSEKFLRLINKYRKQLGIIKLLSDEEYAAKNKEFLLNENNLELIIKKIRREFLLQDTFKFVIRRVLYCNKVKESDYRVAYLTHFVEDLDTENDIEYVNYAIVITPEARDKDIIRVAQDYRTQLGNNSPKEIEEYKYIPRLREPHKTRPQIMIHRECYILSKEGKTQKKIADIIERKYNIALYEDTIGKNIDRYNTFLNS